MTDLGLFDDSGRESYGAKTRLLGINDPNQGVGRCLLQGGTEDEEHTLDNGLHGKTQGLQNT